MKKLLKILTTIAAVLTTAILFTTCKQFRDDPEDFLSYWAAEVVPRGFDIDKPTQKIGGIEYIPSYCDGAFSDVTVTIKLHNPKKFSLVMPSPTSSPSDVQKIIRFPGLSLQPAYGTDYTLEQTPDKAALKLTYKPDFLKAQEWSNGGIGPEITFISTDGRKFGKKFSLNLKADTAPPKPSVTLAQTRDSKHYVLCLKVPDMDKTVTGDKLHKDMTHIEINGTKYELKINGGGTDFIKPADSAFIEASKVEKLPIPDADNLPTGAWVLYYQTDVKAEYGAEKDYTITLIDEQGLVSEELKPTAKAEFPAFYVRGTNGDWYTDNVPDAAEGNDTTGDGSKEKPYATVATALAQCTQNGVPYIILTDGMIEEKNTLNIESGKMITIAALRKDYNPPVPAIIHDNRPNPSGSPPPPRYLVTTAGTLILDSVILKANITDTHGGGANSFVYGIQQTSGTVTVTGKTEIRNFAHAVEIKGGTFTMEEGSICNNYVDGGKSGVAIEGGGTFILKGGSIKDNKATNRAGVSVEGTGTTNKGQFTMIGGEISGNKASCLGGGIYVGEDGKAYISAGTIKANHAAETPYYQFGSTVDVGGGGICIEKGTVNFTGGTIEENYIDGAENNCGAGVFIGEQGIFKMTGGTITGCKTDPNISSPKPSKGGGVFVKHGTFTMSGGTVSGNSADKGGGIYGEQSGYDLGVIKISGGEVSGNTATSIYTAGGGIYSKYQLTVSGSAQIKDNNAPNGEGGGIAIPHGGRFYFTGGTVSGNTAKQGSGIYISTTAAGTVPIEMSGSATVTEDNDVFLDNGSGDYTYIIVTGALENEHAARLTMKDAPGYTPGYATGRVVVQGTSGYALKNEDKKKFPITPQQTSSGLKNWETVLDGNELKLKE
ncbi:right-handed parallel beta-helix repeat-containing protein [Treponema denticola]|uniref:right-handed parallel beta-helix repeat-containing protein n=1 Tax=Treponema denticola TaxID=158 RepID=UPI0020A358F6|nr:right-handed parallel beta-helix repeat-containing protein [Treponema denticola]UTD05311.1 right-handed parallel beta-helix repeat-containing protein [Treponema denticola]